jgi:2-furoyl-CoA dehydrogenase FAD binding subunit
MKPASFTYYQPETLEEALQCLADIGSDGKVIAGGQSLVPILNMRLSAPNCLIDINRIRDLDYIRLEDGWLKIGALTRQRSLETNPIVSKTCPLLAEAVPYIGHVQTRNRGTVGGSLAHADPTAELPLSLVALDGVVTIRSASDSREVPLREFFVTYLTTDLMPDELLTEVRVDVQSLAKGYSFQEFSRRHGDFAMVDAACLLDVDGDGRITDVRLALGGVDAVPVLIEDAAEILVGRQLIDRTLDEVSRLIADRVDPESDIHGSREYRLHLAQLFTRRVIEEAYQRATGQRERA